MSRLPPLTYSKMFPRRRLENIPPPTLHQSLDLKPRDLGWIVGSWPGAALLESGPGFGDSGRWSILAAHPRLVFEVFGTSWTLRRFESRVNLEHGWSDPLSALEGWIHRLGLDRFDPEHAADENLCPFQTGLIGYLGYDLAPLLENLSRKARLDTWFPDLQFPLYDTAVTIDHQTDEVTLHATDYLGEGRGALEERCRTWRNALAGGVAPKPLPKGEISNFIANFSRQGYLGGVSRALEYIHAGDIFQVNLSQRFDAIGSIDPLSVYTKLKETSPAPFSAFLRTDKQAIVSASPEWFYSTRGDRIVTRPIKGTRRRGQTPEEDHALAAELLASPKDRAELTMIVDLERNDLGRVCRYGTVKVREPLTIESFAQVHHLVATVEGRLKPQTTPIDVIRALVPGGSITGAPKIRAMEIIDELEPTRRSLYTGALGYYSLGGASAFNILIRTLLVEGIRLRYQVGGGIVADSDPVAEYDETLHKGRGIREVLEG